MGSRRRTAPVLLGAAAAAGLLISVVPFLVVTSGGLEIGAVSLPLARPILTRSRRAAQVVVHLGRRRSVVLVRSTLRSSREQVVTSALAAAICAACWQADDVGKVLLYADDDVTAQQLVTAQQHVRGCGFSSVAVALFPADLLTTTRPPVARRWADLDRDRRPR